MFSAFTLAVGGIVLFMRYDRGLDLWTGEIPEFMALKARNQHLEFRLVGRREDFLAVQDKNTGTTGYFAWGDRGIPNGAMTVTQEQPKLPEWIPIFSQAENWSTLRVATERGKFLYASFSTPAEPDKVFDFYDTELDKLPWTNGGSSRTGTTKSGATPQRWTGTISQRNMDIGRLISVSFFRDQGPTIVAISFTDGAEKGGS